MGAMGLAGLANYYWFGERVRLRVIKAWQVGHGEARSDECVEHATVGRSDSDLNL